MWEPLIAAGGVAALGAAFVWRWRRRSAEQADREAHLRHQEAVVDALAWMAAMLWLTSAITIRTTPTMTRARHMAIRPGRRRVPPG